MMDKHGLYGAIDNNECVSFNECIKIYEIEEYEKKNFLLILNEFVVGQSYSHHLRIKDSKAYGT